MRGGRWRLARLLNVLALTVTITIGIVAGCLYTAAEEIENKFKSGSVKSSRHRR